MAKKNTLKISTTCGEFSRTTATAYTHAVVWDCPRAREIYEGVQSGDEFHIRMARSGVNRRWNNDRGFAVTWHSSASAAEKAAAGKYVWDWSAKVVGIFEVAA